MTLVPTGLAGRRVLVVEDELMIAEMWETVLLDAGCEVVGPFPRVGLALRAIAREPNIDAGLLDVRLHGETIGPVADALAARGIPFLFMTGYGVDGLPEPHRGRPVLTKPCLLRAMLAALAQLFAAAR
jgi:CheY-like chemotaxis protein